MQIVLIFQEASYKGHLSVLMALLGVCTSVELLLNYQKQAQYLQLMQCGRPQLMQYNQIP
jgi:hypothetical protein